MAIVILTASDEKFSVSRMVDFFLWPQEIVFLFKMLALRAVFHKFVTKRFLLDVFGQKKKEF